ncbi:hypothetical protein GCM10027597_47990 [Saccharopolyspora tripterygii]
MRQYFGLTGLHRDHRAAGGQRLHQARPRAHERAGVGQREHVGHVRGGDLADRVSGQVVWAHPQPLHEPEQRDLDGEQRQLRVAGPVQRFGVLAPHHPPHLGVEVGEHGVEGVGEDREPGVEFAAHA